MTAQISDTFLFKGKEYSLIGKEGGDLASPEQFGMEGEGVQTDCWSGFYAKYELTEESLYLRELNLWEKNGNYLPIGGIEPSEESDPPAYQGLSVVIPFTGKLMLAKDFIPELYIHAGYQMPIAFKIVLEISVKNGRVVKIKDLSKEMEKRRILEKKAELKKSLEPPYNCEEWQHLADWTKSEMKIHIGWASFAEIIAVKLKNNESLSEKEKERMRRCWAKARKNGYRTLDSEKFDELLDLLSDQINNRPTAEPALSDIYKQRGN